MAELDFRHNVSEIPAGQALPRPYQGNEKVQVTSFPDIQSAMTSYAHATNWLSAIGSEVASRASNAIAVKLGGELGKNPQGDIGIPLTDFDKTMQQSYQTQAQATLGLQANKLITDSNIEMAKAPRITPDLIASTNKSLSIGLKNIFQHAPSEIQPHLEYQYGNVQLSQSAQLHERMFREQKEDRRNNSALASQMNAEHAHSFAFQGNEEAAIAAVNNTIKLNQTNVAARIVDPVTAKTNIDTVRQSYLSGKYSHEYENARAQGKGEEYLKSLADKKPVDINDADYDVVTHNVMQYVRQQETLRSENQSLLTSTLDVKMAQNVNSITPNDLLDYQNQVSPIQYQNTLFKYNQYKKKAANENLEEQDLIKHWSDSSVLVRATEGRINKTFDRLVTNKVNNENLSREDAQVQVALSAGTPVPVYIKDLNANATSGNPINIESSAKQIQSLRDLEGGHALIGLSKTAQVITTQFLHQRGSMPDSDLARKITDNILNTKSDMQPILDNIWSRKISELSASRGGTSKPLYQVALNEVKLGNTNFGGKYFDVIYGNDIYSELESNFQSARGDYDTAVKMTKDYVNQHYGYTNINGDRQMSDNPIEKALGYKDSGVVPYIQEDMSKQLSENFEKNKDPNDYFIVQPVFKENKTVPSGEIRTLPLQVTRYIKNKNGSTTQYRYPVNLVGRGGNEWDIVLQTPDGPRNIFLVAPHLGMQIYKPNAAEIKKNYEAGRKGFF